MPKFVGLFAAFPTTHQEARYPSRARQGDAAPRNSDSGAALPHSMSEPADTLFQVFGL